MKAKFFWFFLATGVLLLAGCGPRGDFAVKEAWARPGNAGGNGAVYFVIANPTGTEDVLHSASGEIAAAIELHLSVESHEGGMSMKPQDAVPAPAHQTVKFEPGGLHLMLIGLAQDLKPGDTFSLTLNFEKAGAMPVEVEVREP